MNEDKYYALLGLAPGCSPDQIKKAYKRCVRAWHPDRFVAHPAKQQQAEHKLKHINHAYEHLMAAGLQNPGKPHAAAGTPLSQAELKPGTKWLMKMRSGITQWCAALTCLAPQSHRRGNGNHGQQSAPIRKRAGGKTGQRPKATALADQPGRFSQVLWRHLHPRHRDVRPLEMGNTRPQTAGAHIWMRLHLRRRRAGEHIERIEPVAGVRSVAK